MELLREFADVWLRRRALSAGDPNWLFQNRLWITKLERRHPGFADQLRQAAIDALEGDDPAIQHRAVAALAVVGTPADIPTLRRAGRRGGPALEQHARTAIVAIEPPSTPRN